MFHHEYRKIGWELQHWGINMPDAHSDPKPYAAHMAGLQTDTKILAVLTRISQQIGHLTALTARVNVNALNEQDERESAARREVMDGFMAELKLLTDRRGPISKRLRDQLVSTALLHARVRVGSLSTSVHQDGEVHVNWYDWGHAVRVSECKPATKRSKIGKEYATWSKRRHTK